MVDQGAVSLPYQPDAHRVVAGRTGGSGDRVGNVLSYQLCYRGYVAQRDKRSVSLSPELATAIGKAAAETGLTFSAWLAETAAHRLKLEAGRRGVAEWEAEHGPLTEKEIAEGLARARALVGRSRPRKSA